MLFQPRFSALVWLPITTLLLCLVFYQLVGIDRFVGLQGEFQAPNTTPDPQHVAAPAPPLEQHNDPKTDCARFSAAHDMLIVIKTGATEIHQKLPIHFSTTLRCIPHYIIYSDMAEELYGHTVHDVLDPISPDTKKNNKDFEIYRKLQQYQIEDRNVSSLYQNDHQKAWDLDKWKFIPMMGKALRARPSAKWFYFIETDTAVVWDNVFTYLEKFDATKDWYIGGQTYAGDVEFAHGGTGWIMSKSAVRRVADKWTKEQVEMEKEVADEWVGDRFLAKVLKELEVPLTPSWPIIQGETPYTLDYSKKHWCYPVASYHHVDTELVKAISEFQQEWAMNNDKKNPMRHRDAFERFVQPNLREERQGWDNLCNDEQHMAPSNADDCRKACQAESECIQWLYTPGKCKTGKVVRLGANTAHNEKSVGTVSGWMLDRVAEFKKKYSTCADKDYWVP